MATWSKLGQVKAAADTGSWKVLIDLTSGEPGLEDLWAAAMTAHFGPLGTHRDYLDADGRPSMATLVRFPEIARRMSEAAERAKGLVGWCERAGVFAWLADREEYYAAKAVA